MPKPAHYDIAIIPGQYYDDEFIYPADLTGWSIDLYLNNVLVRSTDDHTLTMTTDSPSPGETTMLFVFTMDETLLMEQSNTYRLVGTDLAGAKKPLFYGNLTVMDIT